MEVPAVAAVFCGWALALFSGVSATTHYGKPRSITRLLPSQVGGPNALTSNTHS